MTDLNTAAEALLYVLDNDSSQGQLDAAKGAVADALRGATPVPGEPVPDVPTVAEEPTTDAPAAESETAPEVTV